MNLIEIHQRINEAREEYDKCPVCGDTFDGVDGTKEPSLVFIHEDRPRRESMCSLPLSDKD